MIVTKQGRMDQLMMFSRKMFVFTVREQLHTLALCSDALQIEWRHAAADLLRKHHTMKYARGIWFLWLLVGAVQLALADTEIRNFRFPLPTPSTPHDRVITLQDAIRCVLCQSVISGGGRRSSLPSLIGSQTR